MEGTSRKEREKMRAVDHKKFACSTCTCQCHVHLLMVCLTCTFSEVNVP
jgi:hypothetical protein